MTVHGEKLPDLQQVGAGGIRHEFEVPFERADIWKALISPEQPLGTNSANLTAKLISPGVNVDQPISEGAVRELSFSKGGKVKNRLVQCIELELLVWEVLVRSPPSRSALDVSQPPCCLSEQ